MNGGSKEIKTVLAIAGSDCSGGAGIQADLKTMEAHGVYGMSVITALTAQNTTGVMGVRAVDGDFVQKQMEAVFEDIFPDAVKIGMLPDIEVMSVVADALKKYKPSYVVLDPVLSSTSGTKFSKKDEIMFMKKKLFCLCSLITPNIPEAEILSGRKINSKSDMEETALFLADEYGCSVLLKGGHSSFDENRLCADCLCFIPDKAGDNSTKGQIVWYDGKRIDNPNTHGTGCTLSSAISCNLAGNMDMKMSVKKAKNYIESCIAAGLKLGKGRGPLLHNVLQACANVKHEA